MIPNENNLQCRLHFPDLKTDLNFYHEGGGIYYELLYEKHPLFTGTDYRPASDHFSISSMVTLLNTLTCPSKEAEKEYGPGQQSWLQTIQGTALACYIKEYNDEKQKKQAAVETYFKQAYTKYIHSDFFSLNDVVGRAPNGRIYITVRQRNGLRKLFLTNTPGVTAENKIDEAIEDSFKKLKKHTMLETVIFSRETVSFMGIRSNYYSLHPIIQLITQNY